MIKITLKGEVDIKRLYLPYEIKINCPICESKIKVLGEHHYLSHLRLNEEEMIYTCCFACNCEIQIPVKLSMTLKYDVNDIRTSWTKPPVEDR